MPLPPLNTTALQAEYAIFGPRNRNQHDQRFGQHIFNKYDIEYEDSYYREDKNEAFQLLLKLCIDATRI